MKCHAPNTPIHGQFKRNLSTYNKILKSSISLAKKTYYEACFNKYKSDIKNTRETINSLLSATKNDKSFPKFFNMNGERIKDKRQIANEFNKYFTNIGPSLANEIDSLSEKSFTDYLSNPTNTELDFKAITTDDIEKIIDNFKPKPSTGHDNISMKLLKVCKDLLLTPITLIVNYGNISRTTKDSKSETTI